MSLALVDDRKGIWPQNLCTNYPSWNVFFLHSSSYTAIPSLVDVVKQDGMCGEEESWGSRLNQVHLEGWLLNLHVCMGKKR